MVKAGMMKNKTTKVTSKGSTETYKCTTNPTSKGSAAKKLVWVSTTCLDINKIYKETVVELNKIKSDPTIFDGIVRTLSNS